jgi:hypothetical protein
VKDRSLSVRERRRLPKERIPKYPEVDNRVIEWFKERRENGYGVNTDKITKKALEVFGQLHPIEQPLQERPKFGATSGWLKRFMGRNKLKSRFATSVGQKIPKDAKDIALAFFDRIDAFRADQVDNNYFIANMDELPVYFDSPYNKTFDFKGNKSVNIKTTGYEKMRFTLILCAYNDGRKCRPTIIFKGLKKVPKGDFKGVEVMVADGGSVNTDVMKKWIKTVWKTRPGNIFLNQHAKKRKTGPKCRTLLTMDSATAHRRKEIKQILKTHYNTAVEIIPGGMTPLIQPADVSWNRPIKASIKRQWNEWFEGPKQKNEFSKTGKLRRPSYTKVAKWCLNAWNELDVELIKKSFKNCNLDKESDEIQLNSKLLEVITASDRSNTITIQSFGESTGLTDNESDEEGEEFIDFTENSDTEVNESE